MFIAFKEIFKKSKTHATIIKLILFEGKFSTLSDAVKIEIVHF